MCVLVQSRTRAFWWRWDTLTPTTRSLPILVQLPKMYANLSLKGTQAAARLPFVSDHDVQPCLGGVRRSLAKKESAGERENFHYLLAVQPRRCVTGVRSGSGARIFG